MGFSLETSIPVLTVFVQGLLSFFSPCVLPLIPLYVGYLAGGAGVANDDGTVEYPRKKVFVNTLFFVVGVSFAFFLLGFGPLQRPVVGKDKALRLNSIQRACVTSPVDFTSASIRVCSMASHCRSFPAAVPGQLETHCRGQAARRPVPAVRPAVLSEAGQGGRQWW